MGPSLSPEPVAPAIDAAAGELLLDLAEAAVADGLGGRSTPPADLARLPDVLVEPHATFVSVHVDGELNGCIGMLTSTEPLALEVQRMARSAAFADPRLPALRPEGFERCELEVSVLSAMQPIAATSRAELIGLIRPRTDGLVLSLGNHRGLFLPVVWEQLSDPDEFLDHLHHKAGLIPGRWDPAMRFERFVAREFRRQRGVRS